MIIFSDNKGYEMGGNPNVNPYPDNPNALLLPEFLDDECTKPNPLVQVVLDNYPYYDIVHADGIVTDIIPTAKPDFDVGELQAEIQQLKLELTETDYVIIKCQEYALLELDLPYDLQALHVERQGKRDRINEIEDLLN